MQTYKKHKKDKILQKNYKKYITQITQKTFKKYIIK